MLVVSEGCVELIVDFVICFGDNEKNLAIDRTFISRSSMT